jgi:hypothetical protein
VVGPSTSQDQADPGACNLFSAESFRGLHYRAELALGSIIRTGTFVRKKHPPKRSSDLI